jgi:hypothetical protein
MFDPTENRCNRHSHHLPSRLHRLFLLFVFCTKLASAQIITPSPTPDSTSSSSTAPSRDSYLDYTKLPREKNSPINTSQYLRPEGKTDWNEFWKNVHGSYGLSFMGPRIAGNGNETFNIYIPDVAPLQLAHSWQLGVQVNPWLQLGISQFAIQNISDNVTGNNGVVRGRSFDLYDPEIYANFPNLIQIPGWFVFTSAKFSIPVTQFSQNNLKITQITLDQSWTTSNPSSDWSFGFSAEIQPILYADPKPAGLTNRKTLYASVGHLISYRISPTVNFQSTSTIDLDHRAPDPNGPLHFTSNLDDTSRLSLYLNPIINNSLFVSFGGYFQFLLWKPSMETSILGMDFNISF